MLLYGLDRELKRWASERLGIPDFGPSVAIGVAHKGKIVAAAIFSNYRPPNIEITFATSSPRWASPGAVKAILGYPFRQLRCKRITAITEATNQPARAFLCRLGFQQEGYHPDALPSGDAITYGLLAARAARWIAEETNVEGLPASAARARSGRDLTGADRLEHRDGERQPHQCGDAMGQFELEPRPGRPMDADLHA